MNDTGLASSGLLRTRDVLAWPLPFQGSSEHPHIEDTNPFEPQILPIKPWREISWPVADPTTHMARPLRTRALELHWDHHSQECERV